MTTLKELVEYTDGLLEVEQFRDYAPNGLQVEGRADIKCIVSGVTACQELIERAIAEQADAIIVHHGYFWKGEDACITGMKRRRLVRLLQTITRLMEYHLPLDAHAELGNNAQLAQVLGLRQQGCFGDDGGMQLGQYGKLATPMSGAAFADHISQCLGRTPQYIAGSSETIDNVGWCTGAAQSYNKQLEIRGLDAFISGEISEQTVHAARECGIHYFAAGHHATERFGVQALGAHLAGQFGLRHVFIDVENPV